MKKLQFCLLLICTLFSLKLIGQPANIFNGGNGKGNTSLASTTIDNFLYLGGDEDGAVQQQLLHLSPSIYNGDEGKGNDLIGVESAHHFLHLGGTGDGKDVQQSRAKFIWTGAIGSGWTVNGNWNYNTVPDLSREVIIPSGAHNWPYLNYGLLSVGENPDNGQYVCKSLLIRENAILVTRINNRIENYGLIEIKGLMQVKNQSPNAFKNNEGGIVLIKESGTLNFKQ